jgi:hypothetical protein
MIPNKSTGFKFISNRNIGEESKIEERERVCETAHGGKGEIALVVKVAVREIHLVGSNVGLICEISKIPEIH